MVHTKKKICDIVATTSYNHSSRLIPDKKVDESNFVDSLFKILTIYFEFVLNVLVFFS